MLVIVSSRSFFTCYQQSPCTLYPRLSTETMMVSATRTNGKRWRVRCLCLPLLEGDLIRSAVGSKVPGAGATQLWWCDGGVIFEHTCRHSVEHHVHGSLSNTAVVVFFRLIDAAIGDEGVHLVDTSMDEWHELTAKLTKLALRVRASGLDCAPEQPLLLDRV